MTTLLNRSAEPVRYSNSALQRQLRPMIATASVTLFAALLLMFFLMPFAYGAVTAIKTESQVVTSANESVLPMDPVTFDYQGQTYNIFNVPFEDGTRELALISKGRETSTFIDPANPDGGEVIWEGRWRTLQPVQTFAPTLDNFGTVWQGIGFPLLLRNTLAIAAIGLVGTLISSVMVAYGFARFPIPGKNIIFLILIGTIILPKQVTLVPTYTFFASIGWVGTWLPLIVPHFFANAYNVFLLRQYFLTLPRELDEAAMIDGANPLQILLRVILPQSLPVLVAVSLFHIVFAWNDYFEPLIYLLGKPELQPISVGIQRFNFVYDQQPHLLQAASLLGLILPVALFIFTQRFFMRGVVVTGVDK